MRRETERLNSARWIYRRLFRGVGILFLAGVLTSLYLACNAISGHSNKAKMKEGEALSRGQMADADKAMKKFRF